MAQVPLLLLVSSRMAGVVFSSPVFSARFVPSQLRAAFSFLLAILILPGARFAPGATEGTALLASCVFELLIGLLIGFLGQLILTAAQMAGAIVDLEMGFSMAQIMDPATGHVNSIMSSFFQTLALVIYLTMNGHHWLLRALDQSYDAVAAGGLIFSPEGPLYVVKLFGTMLSAAIQMILPFLAAMLLASVALGAVNRAVPQMHVFAVGMGIKAVAGLAMLMVLLPYLLGLLENLFSGGHSELLRTLQLL